MKNKSVEEILLAYSAGEYKKLEDANKALKAAGSHVMLDPQKNVITTAEYVATVVGNKPEDAQGYGLMSTGTGTLDKVHVVRGALTEGGNQIMPNGKVDMAVTVYIGGKKYSVHGKKLVEWRPEGE